MILIPVMLVFAIMMIVSNIALLRHESFRVQNILGLGIGFALIACEAIGVRLVLMDFSGSEMQMRIFYTLSSVYFTVFTYFECILIGSVVCGLRAARHIPAPVQGLQGSARRAWAAGPSGGSGPTRLSGNV